MLLLILRTITLLSKISNTAVNAVVLIKSLVRLADRWILPLIPTFMFIARTNAPKRPTTALVEMLLLADLASTISRIHVVVSVMEVVKLRLNIPPRVAIGIWPMIDAKLRLAPNTRIIDTVASRDIATVR
jgi:hypothetical protein